MPFAAQSKREQQAIALFRISESAGVDRHPTGCESRKVATRMKTLAEPVLHRSRRNASHGVRQSADPCQPSRLDCLSPGLIGWQRRTALERISDNPAFACEQSWKTGAPVSSRAEHGLVKTGPGIQSVALNSRLRGNDHANRVAANEFPREISLDRHAGSAY
jgi:hypothetical protein